MNTPKSHSHGELDPYRVLEFTENTPGGGVTINIKGGLHCTDLRYSRPDDLVGVKG